MEKNPVPVHSGFMTDAQRYLAIGLPVFAVVLNMVAGIMQMKFLGARLAILETSMNARFDSLENRFTRLEAFPDRH